MKYFDFSRPSMRRSPVTRIFGGYCDYVEFSKGESVLRRLLSFLHRPLLCLMTCGRLADNFQNTVCVQGFSNRSMSWMGWVLAKCVMQCLLALVFFVCFSLFSCSATADISFDWYLDDGADYIVAPHSDSQITVVTDPCRKEVTYSISAINEVAVLAGKISTAECKFSIGLNLNKGYYTLEVDGVARGIYVTSPKILSGFFGVDAALTPLVLDEAMRSRYIRLLNKTGIHSVRDRLMWSDLSPATNDWNGRYNSDVLRREYLLSGIKVLDVIQLPNYFLENNLFIGEESIEAVLPKMVSRWGEGWLGIEPRNEPNNIRGELGEGGISAYVDSYVSYSKAFSRAVGNDALIVSGALAGPLNADTSFIRLLSGNEDFFHIPGDFSFHTYEPVDRLDSMLNRYKAWLTSKGFRGKMWITESGGMSYSPDLRSINESNKKIAAQIAAKSMIAYSAGVRHYFAFILPYFRERDRAGELRYFGLADSVGSPFLSLASYVQAAQVFSGVSPGDIEVSFDGRGFKMFFPSENGFALVFYSPENVVVPMPSTDVRIEGIDGRVLDMSAVRNNSEEKIIYCFFSKFDYVDARRYFLEVR